MNDHPLGAIQRPSWLPGPCPDWCTREHHEDDHPEDRVHRDQGVSFPAVIGHLDSTELTWVPHASDLVIGRVQHLLDPTVWVVIAAAESREGLAVTQDSAATLRHHLPG